MHPLIGSLRDFKDAEIQSKIADLTKKYYMTSNPSVRAQMVAVLEDLNAEQRRRDAEAYEKMMAGRDKGLDKLIKVS